MAMMATNILTSQTSRIENLDFRLVPIKNNKKKQLIGNIFLHTYCQELEKKNLEKKYLNNNQMKYQIFFYVFLSVSLSLFLSSFQNKLQCCVFLFIVTKILFIPKMCSLKPNLLRFSFLRMYVRISTISLQNYFQNKNEISHVIGQKLTQKQNSTPISKSNSIKSNHE